MAKQPENRRKTKLSHQIEEKKKNLRGKLKCFGKRINQKPVKRYLQIILVVVGTIQTDIFVQS